MNKIILITITYLFLALNGFAQPGNKCSAKIGSNYYINCKHIITFDGQDVFTIKNSDESDILINFEVFSENGTKTATITNSKITTGDIELFTIKSTDTEFSFVEKASNRIICFVKKVHSEETKKCELHVWVDMYMPSGFYFQCTPETTNVPSLNMIKGSIFANSDAAIQL